jgi:hypothetical protein
VAGLLFAQAFFWGFIAFSKCLNWVLLKQIISAESTKNPFKTIPYEFWQAETLARHHHLFD